MRLAAETKRTAAGIPTWSPTVVLICRSTAYVWQSGRDAQFSADYGRTCQQHYFFGTRPRSSMIACTRLAIYKRIPDYFYLFVCFAHHAIFCPNLKSDVGRTYKDLHVELGTIVLSADVVPMFLLAVLVGPMLQRGETGLLPMLVSDCKGSVVNTRLQYT
jgi:hypothetical protein